jgi:SSS family solute:Na+ symporter
MPQELALPTLLTGDLPLGLGSILLAAIFSAEVSTADAVLFMLATSLSQDLYHRFVNPTASDGQVLRVARWAAVLGGGLGILIALVTPTIVGALSVFYAMLGATLFVPILVALHARVNRSREVTVSILAGAAAVLIVQLTVGNRPGSIWTPATIGLISAAAAYLVGVGWRSVTGRGV